MFNFLDPLFKYLDGGKLFRQPFQILYYVIGVLACLGTLYCIVKFFDTVSWMKGIAYLYAVLMAIVCIATAVFTLLYWFRRAKEVSCDVPENARFLAIPAVGGFIITFAEWFGLVLAVICVCGGILSALILPLAVDYLAGQMFLSGLGMAVGGGILGYIIIILGRLFGEQILAIGAIANDARTIAKNTLR